MFGFAKSDRANLTGTELKIYRKAAKIVLALDERQIEVELAAGRLMEIERGEDV